MTKRVQITNKMCKFKLSPVAIELLYGNIFKRLSQETIEGLINYTQQIMLKGVQTALYSIRERISYADLPDDLLWVVTRDCEIRNELMEEVRKKTLLHYTSTYNSYEFRLRFAEEFYKWVYENTDESSDAGLIIGSFGTVFLVRKKGKT